MSTNTLSDSDDYDPTSGVEVTQDNQFGIIPRTVAFAEISANAKALFGVLAQYAGAAGVAWPSMATLSAKLLVSESTARRALRELVDAGFVSVERRFTDKGQQTNRYHLGAMTYRPPSHRRQGPPVTDDKGPLSPVTPRRRTSEEEPVKIGPRKNYEGWIDLLREEQA